jgi:hypothetical protein
MKLVVLLVVGQLPRVPHTQHYIQDVGRTANLPVYLRERVDFAPDGMFVDYIPHFV